MRLGCNSDSFLMDFLRFPCHLRPSLAVSPLLSLSLSLSLSHVLWAPLEGKCDMRPKILAKKSGQRRRRRPMDKPKDIEDNNTNKAIAIASSGRGKNGRERERERTEERILASSDSENCTVVHLIHKFYVSVLDTFSPPDMSTCGCDAT